MTDRAWDRRHAFLIGLTGAAGTLDALAFLYLGKVFNSFQSGNVLFLGLGAGGGHGGLVIRAAAVLIAFFVGTAAGARLVGDRVEPAGSLRTERGLFAIEAALLALFAVLWLAVGSPAEHPVARVLLLALGAGAMGLQAAFALALKIPNVMTVALTATLAYLGQRTGDRDRRPEPDRPSTGLLIGLCAVYAVCAFVIAVLPEAPILSLAPVLVLAGALTIDFVRNQAPAADAVHGLP